MASSDDKVQVTVDGRLVSVPKPMADLLQRSVQVTIDGKKVEVTEATVSYDPKDQAVPRLTTIHDAAVKAGIVIPTLCHREYMTPVAVCRVCAVQVGSEDGRREPRLSPACYRPVADKMVVATHHTNERVKTSISMLTELLLTDHPAPCEKHRQHGSCELEVLAGTLGVSQVRFPRPAEPRPKDQTSLVIAVDHSACILCDRCVRGCNEIRHNEVLGRRGKGYTAGIAFDLNNPMGDSSCVACGECAVSCPTGALTHRGFVRPDPWEAESPPPAAVPAAELVQMPIFDDVAQSFMRWNEGSIVRRQFRKGEVICREGEYGSTAFYLEKGKVDILIQSPRKHVKGRKNRQEGDRTNWGPLGLIRRFTLNLVGRADDHRDEESTARYIPIDAPVSLSYDKPTATLDAGALFGEMTCMSHYPRSATVRAAEDCTVLEMLRNVLYVMQRGKKSRKVLDDMYRQRAIDNHLRSVPIFASLLHDEKEFQRLVAFLRDKVDLVRVNPGGVIVRQGDPADSFYIIRIGFVKVVQARPGGEEVLAYLGPGKFFGEIGLLSHLPEVEMQGPAGVRVATCSALDHVEVVRLRGGDFAEVLKQFPDLKGRLVAEARERTGQNQEAMRKVDSVPLGDFLKQGLMNAQSLLVLDLERCTRCDECTKACADAHPGVAPNGEIVGVTRLIREGLRFDRFLVTTSCRSCLDPYCMVGCPVGSIRRRESREIIIEDWCIGCGLCANNCPYGNINMHAFADPDRKLPEVRKATTCDLCSELDGQPSCVYACPHDAAFRMTGEHLLAQVRPGQKAPLA